MMTIESWVFILGAPRSGTTWTQLLLSQHPEVTTCPESHLLDGYLAPLHDRVRWERDRDMTGLTSVLAPGEVDDLLHGFAESVLESITSRSSAGTRVFVEKTPQNALYPDLLAEHFPDANFLHVIRDPRDVVASLLAASRTWASEWAPSGPVGAANLWVRHVRGVRRLRHDARSYREIRFEDLKTDTEAELAKLHEWLDLPSDAAGRRGTVQACGLDRLRRAPEEFEALPEKVHRNAARFFRKGESKKRALTASERGAVERIADKYMEELGYGRTGDGRARGAMRVLASRVLRRAAGSLEYRLSALSDRL
mgnify:CR=1 FL=1